MTQFAFMVHSDGADLGAGVSRTFQRSHMTKSRVHGLSSNNRLSNSGSVIQLDAFLTCFPFGQVSSPLIQERRMNQAQTNRQHNNGPLPPIAAHVFLLRIKKVLLPVVSIPHAFALIVGVSLSRPVQV